MLKYERKIKAKDAVKKLEEREKEKPKKPEAKEETVISNPFFFFNISKRGRSPKNNEIPTAGLKSPQAIADPKNIKDNKDAKDLKNIKDTKDAKSSKDVKDNKIAKDTNDTKDSKGKNSSKSPLPNNTKGKDQVIEKSPPQASIENSKDTQKTQGNLLDAENFIV